MRYVVAIALCLVVGVAPAHADSVVMVAGDIACSPNEPTTPKACHHQQTSDLLIEHKPDKVLTTGDNQYETGRLSDFRASYDKTWGRVFDITKPTPGNHEYKREGAQGYFNYFGARARPGRNGYYSFDVEGWHLIALNSNISTRKSSRQVEWLRRDLTSNPDDCTLAYWHHPLYSSGEHGNSLKVRPFWKALKAADAELIVNGHDHDYERFAPQNAYGKRRSGGIREFVVGNGGRSLRPFANIKPHSRVRDATTFGVLKLTLRPGEYEWEFVPETGGTFTDTGQADCR